MKIQWLVMSFILLTQNIAWAHPPSKIELSYNQEAGVLHIVIDHVTNNMRKHHIRKVIVYQNDAEVWTETFSAQTSATQLIGNVTLVAKPQDTIRVKAICSEAGYNEASLVIPKDEAVVQRAP